jgi:phage shock protein PspC (stress-responsive transcriptional regulator)
MIVRIAFVVLTIFSGAGIALYLAGLLLIPEEGSNQPIASSLTESLRSRSR